MTYSAVFITTSVTVTLAALFDIHTRRIPNWITVPAFFTGLILHYGHAGWAGALDGLLGFAIGFGLFFLLWLLGGKGAGDAKLIGAVGALLGWYQLLVALVFIAGVGGLLASLYVLKRRAIQQTLANLAEFPAHVRRRLFHPRAGAGAGPLTLRSPTAITFPYGVPIAVGALLSFFVPR